MQLEVLLEDTSPGVVTHGPRAQRRGRMSGNQSRNWCGRSAVGGHLAWGCNARPKGTDEREAKTLYVPLSYSCTIPSFPPVKNCVGFASESAIDVRHGGEVRRVGTRAVTGADGGAVGGQMGRG